MTAAKKKAPPRKVYVAVNRIGRAVSAANTKRDLKELAIDYQYTVHAYQIVDPRSKKT